MPFAPEYMSRNRLPWDYDPAAECPNFEEILLGTALDADDILTLQKCFGSILLGHNLLQRIVILTGTANGGKSQIADVFQRIVGMHNVANLRTEMLGERFEMSAFVGKTLIAGADVAGDFLRQKQVGKLKSITGGDNLEAETKGGGFRQIKGSFNVMVTCNSRLTVKMEDDADAWRRRLVIIAFVKPPPEKPIQQLSDKLLLGSKELGWAPEASGIINWGLRGAVALLKDSASHGKVLMSKRQLKRVDDLLAESESVRHFVQEAVVKSEKEMAESMTTEELLQEYQGFCADRSWAAIPDSQFLHQLGDWMLRKHSVTMSNDLRREGHDGKTKTKRGYRHVMLTAGPREE
jgi:P4 family phage/plasmid primase-like protien